MRPLWMRDPWGAAAAHNPMDVNHRALSDAERWFGHPQTDAGRERVVEALAGAGVLQCP